MIAFCLALLGFIRFASSDTRHLFACLSFSVHRVCLWCFASFSYWNLPLLRLLCGVSLADR
jgi:hypothetical protein